MSATTLEEPIPLDELPVHRRVWRLLLGTVRGFLADDGFTWASAIAFYLVLSIPPLLIAASAVGIRVVGEETASAFVLDQVADLLPAERQLMERLVHGTVAGSGLAGIVSAVFLVLSGSRIFGTLILAIEGIWDIREQGRFLRRQVLRFVLLLAAGIMLSISALIDFALVVIGEEAQIEGGVLWALTGGVLPSLLLLSGLIAVYRLIPPGAASWTSAIAGGLLAAILIRAAQYLFTWYLRTFGGFESAYGPLASVAVLMTWALVGSCAVVLGAELVVHLERPERAAALGHGKPGTAGRRGRRGPARAPTEPEPPDG